MSEARFRFLSQEDVVAAGGLDVAATIDVVEEALRLHAEGETQLPSESALLWSDELGSEETDGRIMAMPAYVGGSIALAGLIFSSTVGLAIEDVAAAACVYRAAVELGIGTELTLWDSPIWV